MKLLILAYDFPPYVSVGGLRPYGWHKYLKEFGVEPIVITRQWANKYRSGLDYIAPGESSKSIVETTEMGTIIRTAYKPNFANKLMLKYGDKKYKLLRKLISAYYEFAQWLMIVGPKKNIYCEAQKYLKQNKVDCIIATGDPFILFRYANKLGKKFNIPWIADYRDPWTENNSGNNNFFKNWNAYFEKKIVSKSNLIITVSDFVKSEISSIVKDKEFYILPNGYSPEAIENVKNISQNDKVLNIGFAGTIYNWHPIKSFLSVMSNFILENNNAKITINFYGINIQEEINNLIENNFQNIKNYVNIYPKIENNLLLEKLATNNLLLLFNYYSYMGTKIYNYIGIKRTILLCYANDKEALKLKEKYYPAEEEEGLSDHLQEDLINETNSGYIVQDANHLKELLTQLYDEFCQNGYIKCNTTNIEKYSRKRHTQELGEIVKNLVKK